MLIHRTEEAIESFGWADFPLILQPPYPASECRSISYVPSFSSLSLATSSSHSQQALQRSAQCVTNDEDEESLRFGWKDFPCIETRPTLILSLETSLEPNLVETSDDSSSSDYEYNENDSLQHARRLPQVGFASMVEVREYALIAGDHPHTPTYALSLDWSHAPTAYIPLYEYGRKRQGSSRSKPRRLTVFQRRQRLAAMLPVRTMDNDDDHDTIEPLLERTKSSGELVVVQESKDP